ncbi:MAG: hypothetical protein J7M14_01120, partial [Planctomycetes bacterium]|nr:hypothetical protein [Planctomycetota bacterium]
MANKFTWILAGAMVLLVGGAVLKISLLPSPSGPTAATTRSGVLELLVTAVPIDKAIGSAPHRGGNAAEHYVKAVAAYRRNEQDIRDCIDHLSDMARKTYVPTGKTLGALEEIYAHVSAGARKRQMRHALVVTNPTLEVSLRYPPAIALDDVSRAIEALANYHLAGGRPEKAAEIFKRDVCLGWHMSGERAILYTVLLGLNVQIRALNALVDVYGTMGG